MAQSSSDRGSRRHQSRRAQSSRNTQNRSGQNGGQYPYNVDQSGYTQTDPRYQQYPYQQTGYPQGQYGQGQYGQYQQNPYQQNGYQQNGYQQNGYQQNGYQQNGYQQNGYQQNGYQQNGYQQNAYQQDQYQQTTRQNGYQPQPQQYQQPQQGYFVQQGNPGDQRAVVESRYGLTKAQKQARKARKQELLRRRRNRRLVVAIVFLVTLVVAFVVIKKTTGTLADLTDAQMELDIMDLDMDEEEEEALYDGPPETSILFVGDISTSQAQVAAVTRSDNTYDFTLPFGNVSAYFTASDYAVASFETTMVDGMDYGTEPYYNAPIQLAGTLRRMGFRLVSTANTHMLDNGIEGLNSTLSYLEAARLKSVGTYRSQEARDTDGGAYIRNIHKIKFAFLSYTKGTDSVTMPEGCEYALNTLYSDYSDYWSDLRTSQIKRDVQAAKDAGAEVIIALVHFGSEYGRSVSASQEKVADLLLSNGVDVIIGTHSHLVNQTGFQTVETNDGTKKQCFVSYGLGDFYTDAEQENAYTSMILKLFFQRNAQGDVEMSACYIPIYMNVTEQDGQRYFEVLDTYQSLASLARLDKLTYSQAVLYNNLLDSLDTLHNYAGEDLDTGPRDEDSRVVQQALADGEISGDTIRALRDEERAMESAAKAAIAALGQEDADGAEAPPEEETPEEPTE